MAVKAQFLLWAIAQYPQEENFIYLDADVRAYSRLIELESLLDETRAFPRNPIIVTPHQIRDEDTPVGMRENTFRTLIAGTFNLGFLAVRRSRSALEFLRWWNAKLRLFCYMDWANRGLFGDQKWALLGVSFFDMTVLREPGYNLANWNASRRLVTIDGDGQYWVDGRPLRFFHFSGIDSDRDLNVLNLFLDKSSPVFSIRREYIEELNSFRYANFSRIPWSYGKFLSGEAIDWRTRSAYRDNTELARALTNPFAESNANIRARSSHAASLERVVSR